MISNQLFIFKGNIPGFKPSEDDWIMNRARFDQTKVLIVFELALLIDPDTKRPMEMVNPGRIAEVRNLRFDEIPAEHRKEARSYLVQVARQFWRGPEPLVGLRFSDEVQQ